MELNKIFMSVRNDILYFKWYRFRYWKILKFGSGSQYLNGFGVPESVLYDLIPVAAYNTSC